MIDFTKMALRALSIVLLLQNVLADPIKRTQSTEKLQQKCADLLKINGKYFLLDETRRISDLPADMHVNWKSGNLYYTVLSDDGKMSVHVIHKETGLENKIHVSGGQSTTIDNTNNVVYFATVNGVYKQNDDGTTELYAASGKDVMYVTVTKDGSVMYISTYPKYRVFKITERGTKKELISAIRHGSRLTVDNKGNIFFTDANDTACVLQAGQSEPVKIEGVPSDKILDFYVTKDDDKVVAMDQDSHLYSLDGQTASANDWGSFGLNEVNTFALDDVNNVYIGLEEAIKKFKHYDENPCNEV